MTDKNYAGGWESKYHDDYKKAYLLGLQAHQAGTDNLRDAMNDQKLFEVFYRFDDNEKEFFITGLLGAEMPYPVIGWRFGNFSICSRNYRDDRPEIGISMAVVNKVGTTQDKLSLSFIAISKNHDIKFMRGYLITRGTGSDGEPLVFCATKITKNDYENITGKKFRINLTEV